MKDLNLKCSGLAILLLLLLFNLSSFSQDGPGGVGTTDGKSSLKLWLRADKGVFADKGLTPAKDGQPVQQWNDQSGNNLHAIQEITEAKPVFTSSSFNKFPAVTFSAART